jgi:predicted transcriptional regulator
MKLHQTLRLHYGALCRESVRIVLGKEQFAYASDEDMTLAIKQRAHELIEALPDDATWQDLLYAIEFRAEVEAGLVDAKAGRLTETEELRRDYGLRP